MSKYYKAEDVEIAIADTLQFESEVGRPYKVFLDSAKDMLKNLQAIEVEEDCISKAYLEREIEKQIKPVGKDNPFYWRVWNCALDKVVELIEDAPSVVPNRAEGEWVDESGGIEGAWHSCSVCGDLAINDYDYCPNCGAKMCLE